MTAGKKYALVVVVATAAWVGVRAQDMKIDISKEVVGKAPTVFEPQMGTWIVAQDGADKVIKVDGEAFKATLSTPDRLLLDNARKLYGTTNEDLMDNAKQFTMYPIAVLKNSPTFSNGTISMKFKTISGNSDRCSGILFNLKPNGDWLALRYNDTEHNVILWEFHNGVRKPLIRPQDGTLINTPEDRAKWHELKLTVAGADITGTLDGTDVLHYVLGSSSPSAGRRGAAAGTPPDTSHNVENNPVIRPPVGGKVGLWSKTDSTSEFKDYVISMAK
jgi:hypothetical protein